MDGILLVATTTPTYPKLAAICYQSLRKVGYTGPITIVTDMPKSGLKELPVNLIEVKVPLKYNIIRKFQSRWVKTSLHNYTPYDRTLFLDVDIVAVKPFDELWNYLDAADICMVQDPLNKKRIMRANTPIPDGVTYFNAGMILWRKCEAIDNLFKQWREQWLHSKMVDQPPLAKALEVTGVKPLQLPDKYNSIMSQKNSEHVFMHATGTEDTKISRLRSIS